MTTITIFTNFYINSEENFLRMKDSFFSFYKIDSNEWIVNIRGSYKNEAHVFLNSMLGKKALITTNESGKGWFFDTRLMLNNITSDYILYWVEDHINTATISTIHKILEEMRMYNVDYLCSSWWQYYKKNNPYKNISVSKYKYIDVINIDKSNIKKILNVDKDYYLISSLGLFSTALFRKIINTNHPILRRWPKETPFDLEKRGVDTQWLPIRCAIPVKEIFAPIDDDLGGIQGVSLQSRNLYPKRELRMSPKIYINPKLKLLTKFKLGNKFLILIRRIGYHL